MVKDHVAWSKRPDSSEFAQQDQHVVAESVLPGRRRAMPLIAAQFLGLCNGQMFRCAAVGAVIAGVVSLPAKSVAPATLGELVALAFVMPALFCAALAGDLVDRHDKRRLARRLKLFELAAVLVAAVGLLTHELWIVVIGLVLLGAQTVLFDPLKYAALPQLLPDDRLVAGNAWIVAGTFVAVLFGTLFGRGLSAGSLDVQGLALLGVVIAVVGLLASQAIPNLPPVAATDGERGLPPGSLTSSPGIRANMALASDNRSVFLALVGIAWFWLYAVLIHAQLPALLVRVVGVGDALTIALSAFVAGAIVGAVLCCRFSAGGIELGLVSVAAFGEAIVALDLSLALQRNASLPHVLIALAAFGVFAGLFLIPLHAVVQACTAAERRGRVISVGTLFCGIALLLAGAITLALADDGASVPALFAVVAFGCFITAAKAYREAPHLALRFLTWVLVHTFYRVGKRGFENIPKSGPAVLVCNHVSFVDSVVIMAAVQRPIRFVMDHHIHRTPIAGVLFRHSRTIPIATAKEDPIMKEAAFEEVAKALRNGELVGLFPEGAITRSGEINHFRYGVGRIVSETPVAVVPMALRGLWGSFFSRRYGPAMSKPSLLRWLARIELVVGQPVPPEKGSPEYLQELVSELRGGMV